ncbi:MAG: hypothetical protein GF417_01235 [Candidatus Latescibacteria bacterium]|nr:hypothetical protein [bacterium]MBD3423051.1 hypothetical protein [Candidatus Latescibacterota bacterium]
MTGHLYKMPCSHSLYHSESCNAVRIRDGSSDRVDRVGSGACFYGLAPRRIREEYIAGIAGVES